MTPPHVFAGATFALVMGLAPSGHALSSRTSWVPGDDAWSIARLGDLWTFYCPAGGSHQVRVGTPADGVGGTTNLDPVVEVFDGIDDALISSDDAVDCEATPVCGHRCPSTAEMPCGPGTMHAVFVSDPDVADH